MDRSFHMKTARRLLLHFIKRALRSIVWRTLQSGRVQFYKLVSNGSLVTGKPRRYQPVLMSGMGQIACAQDVKFGVPQSPRFFNSYAYIEARGKDARIYFGARSWFNNGFSVVAEACQISFGEDCMIGHDVTVYDSDFHPLVPSDRLTNVIPPKRADVIIGNNVFIGSHSVILKGTKIGDGCVVAAGSIVNGIFPPSKLIGGNPARVIRAL